MRNFLKKNLGILFAIIITPWLLFGILIGPILLADYPDTLLQVEISNKSGKNTMSIVSPRAGIKQELQSDMKAYYENCNVVYTYGTTGFVYVDLHTGHIDVVYPKDSDEASRENVKQYVKLANGNIDIDLPPITVLEEKDLDQPTAQLMKALKMENKKSLDDTIIPIYLPVDSVNIGLIGRGRVSKALKSESRKLKYLEKYYKDGQCIED